MNVKRHFILFKLLFAILHVGFFTKYLSDFIVAGFTTGAAFHIVLSQVNPLLGEKKNQKKFKNKNFKF